ncbi:hypothetical protein OG429_38740 [Streptomyces sp. NBC_00190]|uniref:hypothetical protein n=1 Tax=unclassified Streptomyces TaxID=2593676 RepID=UPI002E2B0A4A|nr:hypothetical protein [Streptomyces sp. NBC_00190]WSZ44676.1 hypothetical protein OG239_41170 [Streptomyces sp. NBC_00868]
MRTPVFELHIRPMFRATDKAHMGFAFDLWDYNDVVANADAVLARLQSDMPPTATGGPWPEEWITLFQRWKDGARKRLDLGTAAFTLQQGTTKTTITATGTFPAAGVVGWLQLESETATSKTYVLHFEAPDAPAGGRHAPGLRPEGELPFHRRPVRLRP